MTTGKQSDNGAAEATGTIVFGFCWQTALQSIVQEVEYIVIIICFRWQITPKNACFFVFFSCLERWPSFFLLLYIVAKGLIL